MIQVIIAVTGIISIWLTQDENVNRRKFACIFGLVGQPFWFYSAFQSEQWGIFVLSFVYAGAWMKGFYLFWILPNKTIKPV
ncbi:MAG: hypothetical protein JKY24_00655 [Pseudomonadales bacterium]|nr:hypothetical protein [Pseudomonadales bacterium]